MSDRYLSEKENEDQIDNFLSLEMHEFCVVYRDARRDLEACEPYTMALKVQGGWIYEYYSDCDKLIFAVFVSAEKGGD